MKKFIGKHSLRCLSSDDEESKLRAFYSAKNHQKYMFSVGHENEESNKTWSTILTPRASNLIVFSVQPDSSTILLVTP